MDFLARALDWLFPPKDGERIAREARVEDVLAQLSPAAVARCAPAATALAPFRTPLMRSLVHEAKFRGNQRAQDLLGALVAAHLGAWVMETQAAHGIAVSGTGAMPTANAGIVIVPIPLSRSRMRERGFNQCEAIARSALRQLDAAARDAIALSPSILARIRDTEHQTALTRAGRAANVRDAFAVPEAALPLDPAHTYIVFDDVLTTGATLQAAIDALRAQGAVRIVPLALAH